MKSKVPSFEPCRSYYGIMTVDKKTTRTIQSLTFEQLGGWGAPFTLFVSRTIDVALTFGYDPADSQHKLLLWGNDSRQCGVVLRYIHYFERCGLPHEEEDIERAHAERLGLTERNGDSWDKFPSLEGLGEIIYFPSV
jgi:hypothetical protein